MLTKISAWCRWVLQQEASRAKKNCYYWVYAKGQHREEDRKCLCDNCRNLHLTLMFSVRGRWSWMESFFQQNYCHACHKRFPVFFSLPSCCVSSLLLFRQHWRDARASQRHHRVNSSLFSHTKCIPIQNSYDHTGMQQFLAQAIGK